MRLIEQGFTFLEDMRPESIAFQMRKLEHCGRICYDSIEKTTEESYEKFLLNLIDRGHESVIEHTSVTLDIITDRIISQSVERHRLNSYSQASTRYIKYERGLSWIPTYTTSERHLDRWIDTVRRAEQLYIDDINEGVHPEEARDLLPVSFATRFAMTGNFRVWRHVLRQRGMKGNQPKTQHLFLSILREFKKVYPVMFSDMEINPEWMRSIQEKQKLYQEKFSPDMFDELPEGFIKC